MPKLLSENYGQRIKNQSFPFGALDRFLMRWPYAKRNSAMMFSARLGHRALPPPSRFSCVSCIS